MTMSSAIADRWALLAPRERAFIAGGAVVVAAALAWATLGEPAGDGRARSAREPERSTLRLARARADAAVIATRPVVTPREAPDVAIRAALARRGIGAADATVAVAGGRATLTLVSVRFDHLVGLIDALARDEALHVAEATILPRVEPGRVRAELQLAR